MLHVPSQTATPASDGAERAAHDEKPPQALLEFMVTQWAPKTGVPARMEGVERFRERRATLSRRFPHDILIVPTGREKIRANDTTYRFRPGTDFYYLTGNREPDAVLVMTPRESAEHSAVMFVEPNPGKTDATFFTDRAKGELWVGPRLGILDSARRYDLEARDRNELEPELASFANGGAPAVRGVTLARCTRRFGRRRPRVRR